MSVPIAREFAALDGHVWLNCAHQGPLPVCARTSAEEAAAWKAMPWELTSERFSGVPLRLKRALGRLIGVPAAEVILANSASYGLHLIANGFPFAAGDEVLTMRGDFPSDILPWLRLERSGVVVRQLRPRGRVLQPAEIADAVLGRKDLRGDQRIVYVLNLTKPDGLFAARDFLIRDGDTIYVTEAPYVQWQKTLSVLTGTATSANSLNQLATGN